jgi:phosphate transport system substrate-binding protein
MRFAFIVTLLFLSSCSQKEGESLISGDTTILVESSDSVAITQQLDIFSNDYPKAGINLSFIPENYAIGQFLADSARVLICDRNLTPEEQNSINARNVKLRSYLISAKSIAIITHPSNPLVSLNQNDLKKFIEGDLEETESYSLLIADGNSSIYFYLKRTLGNPKLKRAGSETELINKVATNTNAIGLIPVDYLIDETSNRKEKNLYRIKAIPIRSNQDQQLYSAATPNMKGLKYPLVQEIYLHDAQGKSGLGTGLAGFMLSDRGQLIFKKMGWYAVRNRERDILIAN